MAEYILLKISDSSVQKFTDSDKEAPGFPPDISGKDLQWHPVIRKNKPAFDPLTHKLVENNGLVGPNYEFDWSLVALTQPEQDAASIEEDNKAIRSALIDVAEIMIIHVDAHLAKGNIAAADFNVATRQKYINLKQRVDRLRGA